MRVDGPDGFVLEGASSMAKISRDPLDLVAQAIGDYHQYPDGLVLFLGTMFAPTKDRDAPGQGFTHVVGDVVTISTPRLGTLVNRVRALRHASRRGRSARRADAPPRPPRPSALTAPPTRRARLARRRATSFQPDTAAMTAPQFRNLHRRRVGRRRLRHDQPQSVRPLAT